MEENKLFKKGIDRSETMKQRSNLTSNIRKERKKNRLKKMRIDGDRLLNSDMMSYEEICFNLKRNDCDDRVFGLTIKNLRLLLSDEDSPVFDDVIEKGLVGVLIMNLGNGNMDIVKECAWCLTNIAYGSSEHNYVLVEHGIIPKFVQLGGLDDMKLRELVVWGLGNIAAERIEFRDMILHYSDIVYILCDSMNQNEKQLVSQAVWATSNICRQPSPDLVYTKPFLNCFFNILNLNDDDMTTDICWALSFISEGDNEVKTSIISSGLVPKIVNFLTHPKTNIILPSIRTLGNIAMGTSKHTSALLQSNIIPKMSFLFRNDHDRSIIREVAWTLSNIAASDTTHVGCILETDILNSTIKLMSSPDVLYGTKKECAWVIINCLSGATVNQVHTIIDLNIINPFCMLLELGIDHDLILAILNSFDIILASGMLQYGENDYDSELARYGGIEHLENFQYHTNNEISAAAIRITEKYFSEEDPYLAPQINPNLLNFDFNPRENWKF